MLLAWCIFLFSHRKDTWYKKSATSIRQLRKNHRLQLCDGALPMRIACRSNRLRQLPNHHRSQDYLLTGCTKPSGVVAPCKLTTRNHHVGQVHRKPSITAALSCPFHATPTDPSNDRPTPSCPLCPFLHATGTLKLPSTVTSSPPIDSFGARPCAWSPFKTLPQEMRVVASYVQAVRWFTRPSIEAE